MAAATDLLEEHGRAELTVTAVIQRARISRKTFYEVFGNANECFTAVVEEIFEMAAAAASAAYARESSWLAGIRSALSTVLCMIDERPGLARIWLLDASAGPAPVLAHRVRAVALMASAVNRGGEGAPKARRPAPLIAEGVVGAALHILQARVMRDREEPVLPLFGALMYVITLPYLGATRARAEQAKAPRPNQAQRAGAPAESAALGGLKMRLTYRTIRALSAVAENPAASNRVIAAACGIKDQGQISKLLSRLERLRLVVNDDAREDRGAPNSWTITELGLELIDATNARLLR